ncbi:MAG: zf-HC2 domain-containing protein [Planctomycetota bacterium]
MNCSNARQFLYAFADGQLSAKSNREIGGHLDACPECSRFVQEHKRMREFLRRDLDRIEVPSDLETRVREALGAGLEKQQPAQTAKPKRRRVFLRLGTLAVAACLLIAVGLTWQFVFQSPDVQAAIIARHDLCCEHCETHHNKDLPDSLTGLAAAISQHAKDEFAAIAPSLTRFGYKFESANFCGLKNIECTGGGHILYVKLAGQRTSRVSVFSIPRWEPLDRWSEEHIDPENPEPVVVTQSDGPTMCISVWHKDQTSYVCCGPVTAKTMKRLAGIVRVALEDPRTRDMFAMLAAGRTIRTGAKPRP